MVRPDAENTASRSATSPVPSTASATGAVVDARRTWTDSPRASVICEATVRCQISS